jgi:type III secretory pathway component EscV
MRELLGRLRALLARGQQRAQKWRTFLLFAVVALGVLLLLLPLPSLLLDLLLAANLGLAMALCGLAVQAGEPLRLPQLPGLLLLSVLLRLLTNVAALRLILTTGDAGWLIRVGGEQLFGGDALIGGVLIAAIATVEYLVLAKGGERVAEVAARFVLDAMPGRQAAIEADLRSGAIDQTQAMERRATLDREAQIYGALDGALRLLKGDVVAALLLLAVGLVGGLLLGVLRQGLELGAAVERYGLLVVGQGLLVQLPVLLNSAAAGLLLTRGVGSPSSAPSLITTTPVVAIEAGSGLGLDAAALEGLHKSVSARLGFALPPLTLLPLPTAKPPRRLTVRLYGATLYSGEPANESEGRRLLSEALLLAAADLLTLDVVQRALEGLQQQQPALLRETVPRRIDLGRLTALLRRLLAQRLWPLDVRAVLETLATLSKPEPELELLTEQVRAGLGRFLVKGLLRSGGSDGGLGPKAQDGLPALLLASEIEELIRDARSGRGGSAAAGLDLEPELARDILQGVQAAKKLSPDAVLLCHGDVRRAVEQLLQSAPETLPVLAYGEVPAAVAVIVVGRVEPGGERSLPFVDSAAVPWQMRPRT